MGYDSGMEKRRKKELRQLLKKRNDPRIRHGYALGYFRGWAGVVFGVVVALIAAFSVIIGLIVIVIFVLGVLIMRSMDMSQAARNDYFMCPWCRYALTNLPDQGLCPECGARYKREVCRELYLSASQSRSEIDKKIIACREKWAWARALRERDRVYDE